MRVCRMFTRGQNRGSPWEWGLFSGFRPKPPANECLEGTQCDGFSRLLGPCRRFEHPHALMAVPRRGWREARDGGGELCGASAAAWREAFRRRNAGAGFGQRRIKRIQLRSKDAGILCLFRIVLVVVLVLLIGLCARVFDYDYDDEDDDDSRAGPSTRPETLVALAKSSLMQPCGFATVLHWHVDEMGSCVYAVAGYGRKPGINSQYVPLDLLTGETCLTNNGCTQ